MTTRSLIDLDSDKLDQGLRTSLSFYDSFKEI